MRVTKRYNISYGIYVRRVFRYASYVGGYATLAARYEGSALYRTQAGPQSQHIYLSSQQTSETRETVNDIGNAGCSQMTGTVNIEERFLKQTDNTPSTSRPTRATVSVQAMNASKTTVWNVLREQLQHPCSLTSWEYNC